MTSLVSTIECSPMPCRQASKALTADAGIVAGILVGQRMMTVGIVKSDGIFRMTFRGAALAHKEIVGPKHMMRFDGDTSVLQILRQVGASQADHLRCARLSADHVILGAPAQGYKPLHLIGKFPAQY